MTRPALVLLALLNLFQQKPVHGLFCFEQDRCGSFFLWNLYPMCKDDQEICSIFPFFDIFRGYNCGPCGLPLDACSTGDVEEDISLYPTQDEICPIGNETCCDLDFAECSALVLSFQVDFQSNVIGESESIRNGPIVPINVVTNKSVRDANPGNYSGATLCGTAFDFTIIEILKSPTDIMEEMQSDSTLDHGVLESIEETGQEVFLFEGQLNETRFWGTVISYAEMDALTFLYVTRNPTANTESNQRTLQGAEGCAIAFDLAVAAFACPPGESVSVVSVCRSAAVTLCEGAVNTRLEDIQAAIDTAQAFYDAGILALEAKHARDIALVFVTCTPFAAGGPLSYALCVARGVAIVEAKRYAIKLALKKALELAIEAALENKDAIIQGILNGFSAAFDACIECECEDSEDPCCGDDDPCCGDEDPCCGNDDPCCGNDDPCCGNDDPCCGNDDPCCGNDDPCCSNSDPCCGSSNPCCGSGNDCDDGGANGDPHLFTFDNLRYSCQGKGEFTVFQAVNSGALVQSRFEAKSSFVTLATGMAAKGSTNSNVVQISIPEEGLSELDMFVDGSPVPVGDYEDDNVVVSQVSDTYTVFFKASQLNVVVRYIRTSFKHLSVRVRLPAAFRSEQTRGLMGSPDDNPLNDWMTSEGTVLTIPTSGLREQEGYDYCVTNWCISDASESLFVYPEAGFDFDFYFGCDIPYPGTVDLSMVTPELQALCGTDQACLIDGIELGVEGAQELLESEADISSASMTSRFRAVPANIAVGESVNVILTANLTGLDASMVEQFFVYRIDTDSLIPGSASIVTLRDSGSGTGDDSVAGDLIYSNVVATLSNTAGESFGFQAVPVIGGNPDPSSPFTLIRLNAVRSFSEESGIGDVDSETVFTINVGNITDLLLTVAYSWPADQDDLDTGTSFLGNKVGFSCGASPYMTFSGDDTSSGGTETVDLLLGDSRADGQWTESVAVGFNAGWYQPPDRGPASLTVSTKQRQPDGSLLGNGDAVSFVIDPGVQSGCSTTIVGSAEVTVQPNGSVAIEVTRAVSSGE